MPVQACRLNPKGYERSAYDNPFVMSQIFSTYVSAGPIDHIVESAERWDIVGLCETLKPVKSGFSF
ncbi:MAG TPA: hypothetical protein VIM89_03505 [Mucilaginibacter sp.]